MKQGDVTIECTPEVAARFGRCEHFCAGVTIPEGPDAPTLADVLGALEAIRALCAHRRPGSTVSIGTCCQIEGRAQALLAAFQPVEPVQETSDGR